MNVAYGKVATCFVIILILATTEMESLQLSRCQVGRLLLRYGIPRSKLGDCKPIWWLGKDHANAIASFCIMTLQGCVWWSTRARGERTIKEVKAMGPRITASSRSAAGGAGPAEMDVTSSAVVRRLFYLCFAFKALRAWISQNWFPKSRSIPICNMEPKCLSCDKSLPRYKGKSCRCNEADAANWNII